MRNVCLSVCPSMGRLSTSLPDRVKSWVAGRSPIEKFNNNVIRFYVSRVLGSQCGWYGKVKEGNVLQERACCEGERNEPRV